MDGGGVPAGRVGAGEMGEWGKVEGVLHRDEFDGIWIL